MSSKSTYRPKPKPQQRSVPAMRPQHPRCTPEGEALGAQLVRLTAPVIARLVREGEPDVRCASCAFRVGTVPNGCPQTTMDALKASMEGVPFYCHMSPAMSTPCHGWYAARVVLREKSAQGITPIPCPWPFSQPAVEE